MRVSKGEEFRNINVQKRKKKIMNKTKEKILAGDLYVNLNWFKNITRRYAHEMEDAEAHYKICKGNLEQDLDNLKHLKEIDDIKEIIDFKLTKDNAEKAYNKVQEIIDKLNKKYLLDLFF